jgi:hemerythrin
MSTLNWKDDFNINVSQIDEQHRQMLDLALDLHKAVAAGHSPKALKRRLDALADYTQMHFAFEETLMVAHDYPDMQNHRQEHANLLQRLEMFRQGLADGRLLQLAPAVDVGEDWVLAHVAGADRQLGIFLNRQNVF